ncbi:ABC transporter permease [Litoreibacter albidus]|uniref:ABC transporter permease n=1 Tax=Litoreibacter albidus TaxID=670155 RepID=UPI0037353B87
MENSNSTLSSVEQKRSANPSEIHRFIKRFFKAPSAYLSVCLLTIVLLAAIFAPLLAPQNPYDLTQLNILNNKLAPGELAFDGSSYVLGTDGQGRGIWSGILYGLRTSLLVGVLSAFAAATIGTLAGLAAGFFGGRLETLIMRIVDLQLSFPTILMALMMLAVLGQGVMNVVIALIIAEWAVYARTSRGSALVEREKEYIEAARCLNLSTPHILFRHLLPNCLPPLIVIATMQIARAIGLEATLSFLGLGASVTEPSLGMLISNGYQYMLSGLYWISFYPGIALLITIVAINLVGDRFRDVLNPRTL